MDKEQNTVTPKPAPSPSPRKPLWRKALKIAGITIGSIAGLILLVCTLLVWILTPGRLTPLVERVANENLRATLAADRVELKFWSTFPRLTLEVDSLTLNASAALASLPADLRATLPADADSLLSLRGFRAGVSVPHLLLGRINLHNVVFDGLSVNLVQIDSLHTNFDIVPPSAPKEEPDTSALALPSITIDRFLLANARPIRWRSLPDSLHLEVAIENIDLTDHSAPAPRYRLQVTGNVGLPALSQYSLSDITIGADGRLHWDSERPLALQISDFTVEVDRYAATFSTDVDFTTDPTIDSFSLRTRPIALADLLRHVPQEYTPLTDPIHTDLTATLAASLLRPWHLADTAALPSLTASLLIPDGRLQYGDMTVDRLGADITATIDGTGPAASQVTVKKLIASGEGIDIDLKATATDILGDPLVDGRFNGRLDLSALPPQILALIPGNLAGRLDSDLNFRLALSDLSANRFHRINARGSLDISDLRFHTDSLAANLNHAQVRLGTNSQFVRNGHKVDSMLSLSVKIDTLWGAATGMTFQTRQLRLGAGTANRASSTDTTEINPFGFKVEMERFRLDSPADSLRASVRDGKIAGALRRFEGNARLPQFDLSIDMGALRMGQALTRLGLYRANAQVNVHMRRPRQPMSPEQAAQRRRHHAPRSAADSLRLATNAGADLNLRLDSATSAMLRQWDFSGHVRAAFGSLATPYFPLRNRLRNIDFTFSADSMNLSDLHYKAGQSDFLINGTISNLRRALTSRRANTLNIDLSVESDTLNVNEIIKALFAGGSLAENVDSTMVWSETADNDTAAEEQLADMADDAPMAALLVPRNIDAAFSMRAKHILYSDLELSDFNGNLLVYDGAINLRDLSARTDLGAIDLNALYSAPDTTDIQFGLGMTLADFRLDRLKSVIPAVDSIMPALHDFAGVVNASVALTTGLYPNMDIDIPSMQAALNIEGDSLVVIDPETYRTVGKWLLFRDKNHNVIDHLGVEVVIKDSNIELYPFMFDIDRYRFGVMGSNDLNMNLNYHVSVLRSPIPFKFGVNVKGTPDKLKIRPGRAKFKERMVVERKAIADNTRINIVEQINSAFRQGISRARKGRLNFTTAANSVVSAMSAFATDSHSPAGDNHTITDDNRLSTTTSPRPDPLLIDDDQSSIVDSLLLIHEGLLPNPSPARFPIKQ